MRMYNHTHKPPAAKSTMMQDFLPSGSAGSGLWAEPSQHPQDAPLPLTTTTTAPHVNNADYDGKYENQKHFFQHFAPLRFLPIHFPSAFSALPNRIRLHLEAAQTETIRSILPRST